MDSEMSERTTVQLGKINTCLDVLEKTFGDKDSKNVIQGIKSLETIATKQHENYQTLLKELTDLKEQMKAGEQASEVKLKVGDIKKDLQSVQQSLSENNQQDMPFAIDDLNDHLMNHDSQLNEESILMMQQELALKSQSKFMAQLQSKVTSDDQFGVRNTPIRELVLPARCIVSTRDFCRSDIELIKILMLIMLDFSNISLHRYGLLIHFKGNISFWLTHLKQYLRVHNLL